MMRMKTRTGGGDLGVGRGGGTEKEWELRPGGMLVQKRTDSVVSHAPPPTIRVRVKYGSVYHEIHISSQSSFGELKKMLSVPTGLHHQDQKLFFKDKERDSKSYLDTSGVKDKSKIVLQEDPISQEKRYLEMRKNVKMEKAAKSISEISLEVDRLALQIKMTLLNFNTSINEVVAMHIESQRKESLCIITRVSAFESLISEGGKLAEKDVVNLIELLMNQLLKLDAIVADGDVKLQRKMQVRRVQKYVETLDMLKIKNSTRATPAPVHPTPVHPHHQHRYLNGSISSPVEQQQARHSLIDSPKQQEQHPSRHSASSSSSTPVVITTQWETFDSAPAELGTRKIHQVQTSFPWDLL